MVEVDKIKRLTASQAQPFDLQKIGHVVLRVTDLERSARFYTEVLGMKISDVYSEELAPDGMVFMRFNTDHHGIALVGGAPGPGERHELHHFAFEVATLDEVFRARDHLRRHQVPIVFEGRRRAGAQIAVEFLDPDGHNLEIYWGVDQVGSDQWVRPADQWRGAPSLEEAVANPVPGQRPRLLDPTLLGQNRKSA